MARKMLFHFISINFKMIIDKRFFINFSFLNALIKQKSLFYRNKIMILLLNAVALR